MLNLFTKNKITIFIVTIILHTLILFRDAFFSQPEMYGGFIFVLAIYTICVFAIIYFYFNNFKRIKFHFNRVSFLSIFSMSNIITLLIAITPLLHLYIIDKNIERESFEKLKSVTIEQALENRFIFNVADNDYIINEKKVSNSNDVTIVLEINMTRINDYIIGPAYNDTTVEDRKRIRTNYLLFYPIYIHDQLWSISMNFNSITIKVIDQGGNQIFHSVSNRNQLILEDQIFNVSLYNARCSYDVLYEHLICREAQYQNPITKLFIGMKDPIIDIKIDPYVFIDILK